VSNQAKIRRGKLAMQWKKPEKRQKSLVKEGRKRKASLGGNEVH
jgi:hypothetical protein